MTVRLRRAPRGDKLVSGAIAISGKQVMTLRGRRLRRPVRLRRVPVKAFRLTVRLRTEKGRVLRSTRRYGACS